MALTINTNVASLSAQRNLMVSQNSLQTSINRLSSGLRVNSASDDPAGLAIATRMAQQVSGMTQAIRNTNDGISMMQTADAGLTSMTDILGRMRDLAIQALNGTNGSSDLLNLDTEYQALNSELIRIPGATVFNGVPIIGASAGTTSLQVGANASDTISIVTNAATAYAPGQAITDPTSASLALASIDTNTFSINTDRSVYGATVSRLNYSVTALSADVTATQTARGRIVDADFATETANLTRANVLQQAGTAVLAQANAMPNQVLTLLR